MRCYRLCVLDDGIWLVIHAGTLDYVKARQRKYIVLGYDTKIKPNFKDQKQGDFLL